MRHLDLQLHSFLAVSNVQVWRITLDSVLLMTARRKDSNVGEIIGRDREVSKLQQTIPKVVNNFKLYYLCICTQDRYDKVEQSGKSINLPFKRKKLDVQVQWIKYGGK